jgi:hypothetical protein
MTTSPNLDEELLELGQRLIREHEVVPAGSVLRSLARATREARSWGCPPEHLLSTVEASTRWHLAQRLGSAAGEASASFPRPRRGGSAGGTATP